MRRLVWLAVGFCGGCAVGAYLLTGFALLPVAIAAAAVAGYFCVRKIEKPTLIMLGMAASLVWTFFYWNYTYAGAAKYDYRTVKLTATATDYAEGTKLPCSLRFNGKTYKATVYYDYGEAVCPGDTLTGSFFLRCTAPGSERADTYFHGEGICFLAYAREDVAHNRVGGGVRYYPQRLRRAVLNKVNALFPADTEGFARALLLGDTSGLTYEQDMAFQLSGIRHVVAVSGMHVSILFALVYLLAGKGRLLTALLGIPVLFLFAAVAGFTPSIIRACVMQLVMILAMLFRREYDPPAALSLAVLTILVQNPFAIASVSFQLSVGCMVGIFLFSVGIQKRFYKYTAGETAGKKLARFWVSSLSVTVSTMLVTTPLCAYYFGCVSIISVLTNMLTLFVITFVFYGIMAGCLLSFIFLPLGQAVAAAVSVPIRYVLGVAGLLSEIPFAAVYTASPYIVLWLVFCYGLMILFWVKGCKHPIGLLSSMAGMLILCVFLSCLEPRLDSYRLTVLDVGQGQCVLLQSKGQTYMVDCGGTSDKKAANTAVAALHSQGIFAIDGVILTHYDKDHVGGLSYFLARIEADVIYLPNVEECPLSLPVGQATHKVDSIKEISCGVGKITLIPGKNGEIDNETSTCILFQAKECDILITGDRSAEGEKYLLTQYPIPAVEVLIAGHHGANESTEFEILDWTQPEIVIISVGENNRYDHPSPTTLLRLRLRSCRVLRTDLHGTILIRG